MVKRIDLMSIYQAQPCISSNNDFFMCLHKVPFHEKHHITRTDGKANFTDLWLSMVGEDRDINRQGKYVHQHFSLLSDWESDEEADRFFESHKKEFIAICLIKYRSDVFESRTKVKETIVGKTQNRKLFYTVNNADNIALFFDIDDKRLKSAIKEIKEQGADAFYSFYSIIGRFVPEVNDSYKITAPQIETNPLLYKESLYENGWCYPEMKRLKEKIDKNVSEKNKKWTSYYHAIFQILNILCQYEQETKYKDLFYIFFPSIQLFLKQLNEGLNKKCENTREKYETKRKIENSVSEFIDSMEILIHHIGCSCANILDVTGRNGLPYDVPMKLCLLYLSALHLIADVFNDETYEYQFCLSPIAYSRPTTNIFNFGLEPGDRLIRVSIAKHELYSPRALLAILAHEVSHYVGSSRKRNKRADYYTSIVAIIVLEQLLPQDLLGWLTEKYGLDGEEEKAFEKDWRYRKRRMFSYFKEQLNLKLIAKHDFPERDYHFAEIHLEIYEIVQGLLADSKNTLVLYMNEVSDELKKLLVRTSIDSPLYSAYEKEQDILDEKLLDLTIQSKIKIFDVAEKVKHVLKETYADLGAIYLLDLKPADYLELYLLSESYILDEGTINNTVLNRVTLVKEIMFSDDEWNELSNEQGYLKQLKIKSDEYMKQPAKAADKRKFPSDSEKNEGFDPFLISEVIEYERDYLRECSAALREQMAEEDKKDKIMLLRNVYRHFALYIDGSNEWGFGDFFDDFNKMLDCYKKDVESSWR